MVAWVAIGISVIAVGISGFELLDNRRRAAARDRARAKARVEPRIAALVSGSDNAGGNIADCLFEIVNGGPGSAFHVEYAYVGRHGGSSTTRGLAQVLLAGEKVDLPIRATNSDVDLWISWFNEDETRSDTSFRLVAHAILIGPYGKRMASLPRKAEFLAYLAKNPLG
jgi:hypothetical protein